MPPARYRVAIVGAGPSGLFAAQFLAARPDIEVDIFDRLPTPYGLLRYGVAPDHTSIKSVATALARVFESPNVRFLGLVTLGRDVTRDELLAGYDAVIYAVGASEDLRMGVPGEDAVGSRSARAFVAWYSGHPDAEPQSLHGVRQVAAVGVGNVAVNVNANSNIDAVDVGIGILSMHSPMDISHKADLWELYRGFKAFLGTTPAAGGTSSR